MKYPTVSLFKMTSHEHPHSQTMACGAWSPAEWSYSPLLGYVWKLTTVWLLARIESRIASNRNRINSNCRSRKVSSRSRLARNRSTGAV